VVFDQNGDAVRPRRRRTWAASEYLTALSARFATARLRAVGRHQTLTPRGPVHETEAPASAAAAYALTDKVSVAVEYRYFDLGKETYKS
jgi:hypothetical protein